MISKNSPGKPKIFFPNLDGLRFIAFFLVYLQHGFYAFYSFFETPRGILHWLGSFLFANGEMGVSIFFVLSGFLITYLILSEIETSGRIDIISFYIRRALRIFPLYYCVIFFALFLYPLLKSHLGILTHDPSRPIYYLSFLSNFDVIHVKNVSPGAAAMSTGLTWSIAVEEQFYLIWPILFYVTPARFRGWIFYCIIAVSTAFRGLHADDSASLHFHTLAVMSDLAIGGLAAYQSIRSTQLQDKIYSLKPIIVACIYGLGISTLIFSFALTSSASNAMLGRLFAASFFAFIVLEQNFGSANKFRLGNSRLLSFWGKYTYGLYLLHAIALTIIEATLKALHTNSDSPGRKFLLGFFGFMLSLAMSFVSYNILEKRFLLLKKRFSHITKD